MRDIKGTTYFFRDSDVYLPVKMLCQEHRIDRIASVGCSTGEETYTLILAGWPALRADGYDINAPRLDEARAGAYDTYARRDKELYSLPADISREAFVIRDGMVPNFDYLTFTDEAKEKATFAMHDIIAAPLPQEYGIMVMSNVLQHLDEEEREIAVLNARSSIEDHGWLICEPRGRPSSDSPHIQSRYAIYNEWREDLGSYGFRRELLPGASQSARIYRKM
jgi:chemotaxis methyl-accepting protein methylase